MDFEISSLFKRGMEKEHTKEYRYLAQDESGFWYLYDVIPKFINQKWCRSGKHMQVGYSSRQPDYDTTYYDLGEINGD